jgi:chromosome segregation ATPase
MSSTTAPTAGHDEERLAKRSEVRRSIAETKVRRQRVADLRSLVAEIDRSSDAAADEHTKTCGPLQSELESLDALQVEAIVAHEEPAASAGARRRELLALVAAANTELESIAEKNKLAKRRIEQEIRGIEKTGVGVQALENELADLSTPALVDRQWMLSQRIKWLNARIKSAAGYVEKNVAKVQRAERENDSQWRQVFGQRLRRWEIEVADAQKQLADTQQELQDLRRQMLAAD